MTQWIPRKLEAIGMESVRMSWVNQDIVLFEPAGEIDISSAPDLEKQLNESIAQGHLTFVLGLEKISFIDCTGLSVLIRIQKKLRECEGDMAILCPDYLHTRRIFFITGMDHVFKVSGTLADATESLVYVVGQCLECAVREIPNCPLIRSLTYPAKPCHPLARYPWLYNVQERKPSPESGERSNPT